MEVKAVTKYVRISPFKLRMPLDKVKGKNVSEALNILKFMPLKAAGIISKTLQSAVANAENNFGMAAEDLYIAQISADGGPVRRWRRFGARGRFKPIQKRSSHISVILRERTPSEF